MYNLMPPVCTHAPFL